MSGLKKERYPTQKRLKELLHYDPVTGVFTRIIRTANCTRIGDSTGSLSGNGYLITRIDGIPCYNHRLAFIYMEGYNPEGFIDHINRVKTDTRWWNLRLVSPSCNVRNSCVPVTNTSGVKGITRRKAPNARIWISQIQSGSGRERKLHYLGVFDDFTEAVAHRLAAEDCLDWAGCDSSSPAYQYMQKYLKGAL